MSSFGDSNKPQLFSIKAHPSEREKFRVLIWQIHFENDAHERIRQAESSQSSSPLVYWVGGRVVKILSLVDLLFSHSVVSSSLQPRRLQHARLPCLSLFPGACSNSCPLSWWCHPTISSSVIPFSSCLQSFPASGSFLMSRLFTSGGQRIGASASAKALQVMMTCHSANCLVSQFL